MPSDTDKMPLPERAVEDAAEPVNQIGHNMEDTLHEAGEELATGLVTKLGELFNGKEDDSKGAENSEPAKSDDSTKDSPKADAPENENGSSQDSGKAQEGARQDVKDPESSGRQGAEKNSLPSGSQPAAPTSQAPGQQQESGVQASQEDPSFPQMVSGDAPTPEEIKAYNEAYLRRHDEIVLD